MPWCEKIVAMIHFVIYLPIIYLLVILFASYLFRICVMTYVRKERIFLNVKKIIITIEITPLNWVNLTLGKTHNIAFLSFS